MGVSYEPRLHKSGLYELRGITNLARQARKHRGRSRRHPCRPVAGPHHRCRSHGHPPRLGALTDLRHIAPVAIFPDRWPV